MKKAVLGLALASLISIPHQTCAISENKRKLAALGVGSFIAALYYGSLCALSNCLLKEFTDEEWFTMKCLSATCGVLYTKGIYDKLEPFTPQWTLKKTKELLAFLSPELIEKTDNKITIHYDDQKLAFENENELVKFIKDYMVAFDSFKEDLTNIYLKYNIDLKIPSGKELFKKIFQGKYAQNEDLESMLMKTKIKLEQILSDATSQEAAEIKATINAVDTWQSKIAFSKQVCSNIKNKLANIDTTQSEQ